MCLYIYFLSFCPLALSKFSVLMGLHVLALRQAYRRALTPAALLRFVACPWRPSEPCFGLASPHIEERFKM